MVLNQVKLIGLSYTYAVTQLCVGGNEHLINCLNMRKYLKQLFAPDEPAPTPEVSSSEEDSDDEDQAPTGITMAEEATHWFRIDNSFS